ncbi:hypothetical protein [Neobacillus sp. Marseille-QA0830]
MKKILITLIVFIALVAGGYMVMGQFSNKPPIPTISVGEKKVEVARGSYCWKGFIHVVCADTISPPGLIKSQNLKPVVVAPESKLQIEYRKEPIQNTLVVNRWLANENTETVQMKDHVVVLPEEKGIYVYEVSGRWKKGDSRYACVIEVR